MNDCEIFAIAGVVFNKVLNEAHIDIKELRRDVIATMACKASLKANDERKIITVWEYQPDLVYSEELRRARKIEIDKDTTSLKEKRIENQ